MAREDGERLWRGLAVFAALIGADEGGVIGRSALAVSAQEFFHGRAPIVGRARRGVDRAELEWGLIADEAQEHGLLARESRHDRGGWINPASVCPPIKPETWFAIDPNVTRRTLSSE